jgi:hypothetical protein
MQVRMGLEAAGNHSGDAPTRTRTARKQWIVESEAS